MDIVAKINEDNSFGGNFYSKDVKENWNTTEVIYDAKYLKPIWNNLNWIEGATQEEIDARNLEKLRENIRQFLKKKKYDGKQYFEEMELRITMQLAGMLITELVPVSKEINDILYIPLRLIESGDYFNAMMIFNNPDTVTPTQPIVLIYWNETKAYCINYFNTNYPNESY